MWSQDTDPHRPAPPRRFGPLPCVLSLATVPASACALLPLARLSFSLYSHPHLQNTDASLDRSAGAAGAATMSGLAGVVGGGGSSLKSRGPPPPWKSCSSVRMRSGESRSAAGRPGSRAAERLTSSSARLAEGVTFMIS